ncbi:MAG: hypothetical protein KGZ75_02275 [Syntrophomonadaceae bacterium]|nr:hypothetical protein [Syntrophomonadaceae bacterium]
MRKIFFREVQRFRQPLIWLLIVPIILLQWWGAFQQLILKKPFGTNPAPDAMLLIFWLLFGIGLPILFLALRLETEVRRDGFYFRFYPLHISYRKLAFKELQSYQAVKYSPLRDYLGWGIRYGPKGKAYNVSGNKGLRVKLQNGKEVLFGSQKPDELVMAIEAARERLT